MRKEAMHWLRQVEATSNRRGQATVPVLVSDSGTHGGVPLPVNIDNKCSSCDIA